MDQKFRECTVTHLERQLQIPKHGAREIEGKIFWVAKDHVEAYWAHVTQVLHAILSANINTTTLRHHLALLIATCNSVDVSALVSQFKRLQKCDEAGRNVNTTTVAQASLELNIDTKFLLDELQRIIKEEEEKIHSKETIAQIEQLRKRNVVKCRKCRSEDIDIETLQKKSLDESYNIKYSCRKCGSEWEFAVK